MCVCVRPAFPVIVCFCLPATDLPAVTELKVWPEQGQLWVEWTAPSFKNASEFIVEWQSGEEMDWQRESRGTRRTAIRGTAQLFLQTHSTDIFNVLLFQRS